MEKPSLFFSHSSKDKNALARLKELFTKKTGDTIDVFLSSDGQSIPFGRNWVYRIQTALDSAKLMIIFLTPNSIASSWIYFEAGYAHSKGVRVVPVGFLGVDLTKVPPPLGLLQGFNVKSNDGLDNIIAQVNDEFHHAHTAKYSREEYEEIVALADNVEGDQGSFGILNELYVSITRKTDDEHAISSTLQAITDYLSSHNVAHTPADKLLLFHGVSIQIDKNRDDLRCYCTIDPLLLERNAPLLNDIAQLINPNGFSNTRITAKSIEGMFSLYEFHSVSARLYGSAITLLGDRKYQYKSVHFSLRSGSRDTTSHAFIDVVPQDKTFPVSEIRELIDILTVRKVFYKDEEIYSG